MENVFMRSLDSFKKLLLQEASHLSDLVRLEEEKYDALKQVEMQQLSRINNQEEDVLQRLDSVEKKRKEVLLSLSGVMHFDPGVSLSELIIQLAGDENQGYRQEFTELRERIKSLTGKLQVTMHENSQLIRTNLEIINLTLNFANRNAQKETYGYRDKKESRENIYLVNQIA